MPIQGTDRGCGAGLEGNYPEIDSWDSEWGTHLTLKGCVLKLLSNQLRRVPAVKRTSRRDEGRGTAAPGALECLPSGKHSGKRHCNEFIVTAGASEQSRRLEWFPGPVLALCPVSGRPGVARRSRQE